MRDLVQEGLQFIVSRSSNSVVRCSAIDTFLQHQEIAGKAERAFKSNAQSATMTLNTRPSCYLTPA